jgi:hypothetical protein
MLKRFSPLKRFSLRALLVLITVGGITLGVFVHRAERQRKAIAWLKEHHGRVIYAHTPSGFPPKSEANPGPQWLIDIVGEHYFFRPESVTLRNLQGDEDLSPLNSLPTVAHVSLAHSNLTGKQLRQLSQVPSIRSLNLHDTELTDGALIELHSVSNLRNLSVMCCRLSAENTKTIFEPAQLQQIYFSACELDLSQVGDGSQLQNLETLYFSEGTLATHGDLKHLASLPKLQEVMFSADWDSGTYAALQRQPALATVYVYHGELSQAELESLAAIPNVSFMHLECLWTPEATERLSALAIPFNLTSRPPQRPLQRWDFDKRQWKGSQTTVAPAP